jgi:endonuclease-3 related protein
MLSEQLKMIYDLLFVRFGPQHWWPGETPFEVIVGAVLTQNTNWGNVEKAIANLKKAKILTPEKLHSLKPAKLAKLIRPAGYFNKKASRQKN